MASPLIRLCGLVLFPLLTLTGCAGRVLHVDRAPTYLVQPPCIPTVTRAGSVDAELGAGTGGVQGQLAVAPLNGMAITAAGQYYRWDKGRDRLRSGELGLGYSREVSKGLRLGLYAGMGRGDGRSQGERYETNYPGLTFAPSRGIRYDSIDRRADVRYTLAYVMPVITSYLLNNQLEISAAAKLSLVRYQQLAYVEDHRVGNTRGSYPDERTVWVTHFDGAGARRTHGQLSTVIGGALTPRLWVTSQLGGEVSFQRGTRYFEFFPLTATMGIRLRLGPLAGTGTTE